MTTSTVMRLPVLGPDTYNTLAVVRQSFVLPAFPSETIVRMPMSIATGFTLAGFDQRDTRHPPKHSTTAALMTQRSVDGSRVFTDGHTLIVTAVDTIEAGRFDGHGVWTIDIDIGSMCSDVDQDGRSDCDGTAEFMISSWLLCYEPPPMDDPPPHGQHPRPGNPWHPGEGPPPRPTQQ